MLVLTNITMMLTVVKMVLKTFTMVLSMAIMLLTLMAIFVLSSSLLDRRAEGAAEGGLALHLVQDVLIRWDSSQCIDLTL